MRPRPAQHPDAVQVSSADAGASQLALRAFGAERREAVLAQIAPSASTSVNGTTYQVGPPRRPDIRHDNGFLQNPNNPADPVPQPTRAPTQEERDYYNSERQQVAAARIASNVPFSERADSRLGLRNALPAYDHFLNGNGANRTFDYAAFLKDDPAGQTVARNVERDVRQAGDALYRQLDQQVPQTPGASVTFQMRSGAITVGSGDYPYPATEDWQKAIGGHSMWSASEVRVTRLDDGRLVAEARITVNAEDRYNFNPNQHDIATGAPDALRGRLEQAGLAHQFTQTGTAELSTRWIIGQPGSTTDIRPGGGLNRN